MPLEFWLTVAIVGGVVVVALVAAYLEWRRNR